jgi:hypothetical protein
MTIADVLKVADTIPQRYRLLVFLATFTSMRSASLPRCADQTSTWTPDTSRSSDPKLSSPTVDCSSRSRNRTPADVGSRSREQSETTCRLTSTGSLSRSTMGCSSSVAARAFCAAELPHGLDQSSGGRERQADPLPRPPSLGEHDGRGGHHVIEAVLRAQFRAGFRKFGAMRRRRNELEYPTIPGEDTSQEEARVAIDDAHELLAAARQLLPQVGLY